MKPPLVRSTIAATIAFALMSPPVLAYIFLPWPGGADTPSKLILSALFGVIGEVALCVAAYVACLVWELAGSIEDDLKRQAGKHTTSPALYRRQQKRKEKINARKTR